MPYNKDTAFKNQKDFLRSQAHCGYPNIEKRARETLAKIEKREKEQEEFNRKIRAFNAKLASDRAQQDYKTSKKRNKTQRKSNGKAKKK